MRAAGLDVEPHFIQKTDVNGKRISNSGHSLGTDAAAATFRRRVPIVQERKDVPSGRPHRFRPPRGDQVSDQRRRVHDSYAAGQPKITGAEVAATPA